MSGGGTCVADILISISAKDNEVAEVTGERIWCEPPTWSLFYNEDKICARQHRQERLLLQRCGDRCLLRQGRG